MILLFILCRAMLIIHDRIEYLSRAVMCAKSCGMLTSGSEEGEVLHEIEEKLEVSFKEEPSQKSKMERLAVNDFCKTSTLDVLHGSKCLSETCKTLHLKCLACFWILLRVLHKIIFQDSVIIIKFCEFIL